MSVRDTVTDCIILLMAVSGKCQIALISLGLSVLFSIVKRKGLALIK